MRAFKSTGFWIVTVGLGLLAGLTTAEMAIRGLALAPPLEGQHRQTVAYVREADLLYTPIPSTRVTGRSATGEFDYDYRHNTVGFRDVEHSVVKTDGTFRILGLGDSFTYGVGVSFEDTYLCRLEAMLNARAGPHPRVEIVKAGIPRYFPEAERMLLERYGVPFRPDLIVVGFLPNDVIDTYLGLEAIAIDRSGDLITREAAALGALGTAVYRASHLGRLVLRRYVAWRLARQYRPRETEIYRVDGFHEKDWIAVEHEYDRMAAIAAFIEARLVVLHIPQRGPWTEPDRYPAVRLSTWAAKRQAGFVDALPAMERGSALQRLYYQKDGHATPAGHAVIAQELYDYLADRIP